MFSVQRLSFQILFCLKIQKELNKDVTGRGVKWRGTLVFNFSLKNLHLGKGTRWRWSHQVSSRDGFKIGRKQLLCKFCDLNFLAKLHTIRGHFSCKWTLFLKCSFSKVKLCYVGTVSLFSLHQNIKEHVNFNYYPDQRWQHLENICQRVLNDLYRTRLFRRLAISQYSCMSSVELTDKRGGGSEGGAKSYDREEAWPSIKHSIISGIYWWL